MSCPFLQETSVRSCRAAGIRKLILDSAMPVRDERCSSPAFRQCSVFHRTGGAEPGNGKCPLLDEQHVRYCAAAAVPQYVPWSELAGQCGGDGHRYCSVFLSIARPRLPGESPKERTADGVPVPTELWYTPNHLWLHASESGDCHVGIDGFLARVLAQVDRISFVTTSGVHRPTAVLTIRGVDWALVFPNRLHITNTNVYLRHAPERLIADPYGAGWLFEGRADASSDGAAADGGAADPRNGLITGDEALQWISGEGQRLTQFVHHLQSATMNDGGVPSRDFVEHLSHDQILQLFHEFFATHAAWAGAV